MPRVFSLRQSLARDMPLWMGETKADVAKPKGIDACSRDRSPSYRSTTNGTLLEVLMSHNCSRLAIVSYTRHRAS